MSDLCSTPMAETDDTTATSIGRGDVEAEKGQKSIVRAPKAHSPRRRPARVKLHSIEGNPAEACPSDGACEFWCKSALATQSSAFANTCLFQLQAAARLPGGGISETAVNAPLAMVEAARPRDEIEAALSGAMRESG